MTKIESLQAELRSMQELLVAIDEAWTEGRTNDDGDYVISESLAARITMLLED